MIRNLLTKTPFSRVTPDGYMQGSMTTLPDASSYFEGRLMYQIVSQADFVREYYPSGHKINSPLFYPNIVKYDEKSGKFFEQQVFRASFPFQQIILVQQLIHLCGNDIHHELTDAVADNAHDKLFLEFQKGWLEKNMEIAFYEFAKSVKITGDGAIVVYIKDGKAGYRNLSFFNGDTLFPHYDSETGELVAFARKYQDYDISGKTRTSWIEVWDKKTLTRYRQDFDGIGNRIANKVRDWLGLDGYTQDGEPQLHGFDEVPVVYHRDSGPCWEASQDSIDKYELAVSQLCQNNMAYAFPIMVLKGDDVEIKGDIYGSVKAITMGSDDAAEYLSHPDATSSFELQLKVLLDNIFQGSFIVKPPEIKSGDLPGVAIKLIYSPSLEKAIIDSREFDRDVDALSRLFKFAYAVELKKSSQFANMRIFSWIEPYVHQNTTELINNLVQLTSSEILSRQTATDLTGYGRNQEWDRIIKERKEEQMADRLTDINGQNGTGTDTTGKAIPAQEA